MKTLKKISLRQLDKAELNKRQENLLFGGGIPGECQCKACATNGEIPSTADNRDANYKHGYLSNGDGNTTVCTCPAGQSYGILVS